MINHDLNRMVIYVKDIQRITGRTERYCRKIMGLIRNKFGKEKHQLVSVNEFCQFMGLPLDEVRKYLKA
ncbi:hypothetical protein KK060_21775 [Fulvivirgaceae bacterium PWU20]|uniref:Uncharacterized protein n=1 Tax=Chryseosolibacter indicus TaxID=2782351 RepID=A0ABS5VYJ5_9BACT|nr:hypothetical protein [Chryseosolibacter indicus]